MSDRDLLDTVFEALTEIAPEIDPSEIETDQELRAQVDIDSMDLLNFVIGVHERTGIDIPEADYPKLRTLDELVAYLQARKT
jgi:acyl carrier protein